MGIQEVSGKGKAYVITADVPKPTDSRGKGYGSMYTDMRWKIWEQVQQSTMAELGMDMEIYQMQKEQAAEAIESQRQILADLKAGKLAAQDALAKDRMDTRVKLEEARAQQKRTWENKDKTVVSQREFRGEDEDTSGRRPEFKGTTADDKMAVKDTTSKVAEWRVGGDGADLDTDAAMRYYSGMTDETVAGVGMTQEGKTRGITPEGTQYLRASMVQKALETEYDKARKDPEYKEYSDDEIHESLMDSARENFNPETMQAWDDTYGKTPQTRPAPSGSRSVQGRPGELYASRVETGRTVRGSRAESPLTDDRIKAVLDAMPSDVTGYDEAIQQAQRELDALQGVDIARPALNPLERTRRDFAEQVGAGMFGTAGGLRDVELGFLRGEEPARRGLGGLGVFAPPPAETPAAPELPPVGPALPPEPPVGSGATPPEDIPAEPPVGSGEAPVASAKPLPASAGSAIVAGAEVPEVKTPVAPDLAERRNYRAGVVRAAHALASKPKQFARKYKTGLRPEERRMLVGEHVSLVDELYATNVQNKSADAYAATWKELSKALGDNPSKLKEAHTYLVAKDIIENTRTT